MHPLFSFLLYNPRQMQTHFLQINEYKAYRSNKETCKRAKNTHENRNVGMIRVIRWVMIKMWGLAGLVEGHKRLEISAKCCLFFGACCSPEGVFRVRLRYFYVAKCVLNYAVFWGWNVGVFVMVFCTWLKTFFCAVFECHLSAWTRRYVMAFI